MKRAIFTASIALAVLANIRDAAAQTKKPGGVAGLLEIANFTYE